MMKLTANYERVHGKKPRGTGWWVIRVRTVSGKECRCYPTNTENFIAQTVTEAIQYAIRTVKEITKDKILLVEVLP